MLHRWICRILFLCLQIEPFTSQLSANKSLIWSWKTGLSYIPGDPADVFRDVVTHSQTSLNLGGEDPNTNIKSVCSDHHAGAVYFTELQRSVLFETDTNYLSTRVVHQGFGNVVQLTVDWSSRTLYWVDGWFNWIALKSLRKDDPSDYKILVECNVDFPRGIAVDPKRGYLFWTDVGRTARVKRARLDGDSPRVIAIGGLYEPLSLTIDIQTGWIYWVDWTKETVEYYDYEGNQRNILVKMNALLFYGIAYYQNFVFVTDQKEKRVLVFPKGTGVLASSYPTEGENPNHITVYAPENQPYLADPCEMQNCEHFCVKFEPASARCLCQNGFILSPDGRSCTGSSIYSPRLITFASKTHVCFINITALSQGVPLTPYCPVSDGVDITAISPDSKSRTVYYADRGKGQISRVSLRSGQSSVVISNVSTIQGMTYDWLRDTLYWTDSGTKQVKSYRIGSGRPPLVVLSSTDSLGQLTLDPFSRQIFWISQSPLAIRSVSYDTPRTVRTLVSTGIRDPGDIHCDPVKQTLYWTDSSAIKSVYTNGTGDQTIITTVHNNNKGLVVHKSIAFWTAQTSTASINSGVLQGRSHSRLVPIASPEPITDLDIVDIFFHRETRGACFENGGCDHYCVETGESVRECLCELGFDLQRDGQSCQTESLNTSHILVADFSAARFYQVDLITGRVKGMFRPGDQSATVALNPDNSLVYWSGFYSRSILSSDLNGTNVKTVLSTGIHFTDRLAVDPITGNIFFSAVDARGVNGSSYIGVVTPDGRSNRALISGLNTPRAVALHSAKAMMFWSDYGSDAHIGLANMDGSKRINIITTNIIYVNGIAIDVEENRLFWSDGGRNVIERCTLFGAQRRIILTDSNAHLMAVQIYGDKLYYTAWSRPGITVVNKADGSHKHYLMESPVISELSGFVIVQPNQPSSVNNACSVNNGGCSALCLPTPTGRTCSCRDNVLLGSDGRTCAGDNPRTTQMPSTARPPKTPTTFSPNNGLTPKADTIRPPTTTTTPSAVAPSLVATSDNTVVIAASSTTAVLVGLVFTITLAALIFRRKKSQRTEQSALHLTDYLTPVQPSPCSDTEDIYCTALDDDSEIIFYPDGSTHVYLTSNSGDSPMFESTMHHTVDQEVSFTNGSGHVQGVQGEEYGLHGV